MTMNQTLVRRLAVAAVLAIGLLLPSVSQAVVGTLSFVVTGNTLTANSTTNTVKIYIRDTTADTFHGVAMYIQIGDGGNNINGTAQAQVPQDGPMISGVNLSPTGGYFAGATNKIASTSGSGVYDTSGSAGSESQVYIANGTLSGAATDALPTAPITGTPPGTSLLLTMVIDTQTGASSYSGISSFPIYVRALDSNGNQPAGNNSSFSGGTGSTIHWTDTGASLFLPEPTSLSLLGLVGIPALMSRRRRVVAAA